MPKKRINQRQEYIAHYDRTERYMALIDAIFEQANKDSVKLAKRAGYDGGKLFSFNDYPQLKTRFSDLMNTMASDIQTVIVNGATAEWDASNVKNDALTKSILGKRLTDEQMKGAEFRRFFQNNKEALNAFLERKQNGMNLSSRIWNTAKEYRSNLELALSAGLADGKSAAELSRDIRACLNDPQKLFRRVRKNGKLVLSKAAKAYNPGAGVYRSSYKNALRLARTEINMAYRTADCTRWQQLDFVVGLEIKRSGRKYPCPVCEELAGKYPKDFVFSGWHPNCRCYIIPILMKDSEFWAEADSSVNEVKDVPENFKRWINENKERIAVAGKRGSLPYFIKDNKKQVFDILHQKRTDMPQAPKTRTREEILAAAQKRHAARTPEQIADIQRRWTLREAEIRHAKRTPEQEEAIRRAWNERKNAANTGPFSENGYSRERKKTAFSDGTESGEKAFNLFRDTAGKNWTTAPQAEKDMVYEYTHTYHDVNDPLRGIKYNNHQTVAEFKNKVSKITSYIEKNELPADMWCVRADSDINAVKGRIEFAGGKMPSNLQDLVGMTMQEGGFMSTSTRSVSKGAVFSGDVIIEIFAPKGTKGAYIAPTSFFGGNKNWDGKQKIISSEKELLIQRGTKMRITKVYTTRGKTHVECEIIGQEVKDISYVKKSHISTN